MTQKLFALIPVTRDNLKKGMILRAPCSDGSVHVFNDAIVECITFDRIVHLARPFAMIKKGHLTVGHETTKIPLEYIVRDQYLFIMMEGDKPANCDIDNCSLPG